MNNELLLVWYSNVQYSDHHLNYSPVLNGGLNTELPFDNRTSEHQTKLTLALKWHLNSRPFNNWKTFDHLNTDYFGIQIPTVFKPRSEYFTI